VSVPHYTLPSSTCFFRIEAAGKDTFQFIMGGLKDDVMDICGTEANGASNKLPRRHENIQSVMPEHAPLVFEGDREEYLQHCETKCEAPIKLTNARLVSSAVPYWRHVAGEEVGGSEDVVKGGPSSNRQDRKGASEARGAKLCLKVAKGTICPFGNECKYSHNVEEFLKSKPDDLPGVCPLHYPEGSSPCPYGFTCRYLKSHSIEEKESGRRVLVGEVSIRSLVDCGQDHSEHGHRPADDFRFWMDDGTVPKDGIPVVLDVNKRVLRPVNDLGNDVRKALRSRLYDFSSAMNALQQQGIQDTKKKGSKRPKCENIEKDGGDGTLHQQKETSKRKVGCIDDGKPEKKIFDARGKTYLAPLTTVGNLPFRRICKRLGADITCGEMAMADNLIQGQQSEWALLKRHPEEDFFGVQICGAHADSMTYCAQLIEDNCDVDFVDVNCGCPIDCVVKKGAGSFCLTKPKKLEQIVRGISSVLTCPVTIKMRRGFNEGHDTAHTLVPRLGMWGASAAVLHGRTRQQRYSKPADWEYIKHVSEVNSGCENPVQVIGNGDVYSWQDHVRALESSNVATTYIARGALIKPWIFAEIKEKRDWDISASERLDIVRQFVRNGLEHWGSDSQGVESTRKFLLEWLSFTHRYIPSGLLEVLPQKSNWRPTAFVGRSDLETLLGSPDPDDWVRISELFLGKVPQGFKFSAKHKAKSHNQENG
jgi:tRNA-dihydrouridine synthase 3